ncbi:MAG TPA: response regulator transcription factor, partial [Aestuariivirgaceae bacterium]|nr:response regulator transcription factor [Aestuariivirgaceae bacterium]
MSVRTCLIGQSNLFRAGLKMLLKPTSFAVTMEAESLNEIEGLDWNEGLFLVQKPDDVRDIEAAIAALKTAVPKGFVVLLAQGIEADQLALSFAAGADGYLLEEISPEALLESLNLVMLGEKVFPSRLAALLCADSWSIKSAPKPAANDVPLSGRELEIVQRLTDGLPNKIIASELSITEATVKVHLKTILKKIGAQNRTQAAIWAVQRGFSTAPDMLSHNDGMRALKLEP